MWSPTQTLVRVRAQSPVASMVMSNRGSWFSSNTISVQTLPAFRVALAKRARHFLPDLSGVTIQVLLFLGLEGGKVRPGGGGVVVGVLVVGSVLGDTLGLALGVLLGSAEDGAGLAWLGGDEGPVLGATLGDPEGFVLGDRLGLALG